MGWFKNEIPENQNTLEREQYLQFQNLLQQTAVFSTIDENMNFINSIFGNGFELIQGRYNILGGNVKAAVVYIESIADSQLIRGHILTPLLISSNPFLPNMNDTMLYIKSRVISVANTTITTGMAEVVEKILNGDTMLFIEGANSALITGSRKVEKKAIEKPENEESVLGSQESFTDDIRTNVSLLLKRLPVPELKIEEFTAGTLSHTKIKLMWLNGIANQKLIEEAEKRIQAIEIDHIDGIGSLAELIADRPFSIFPKYKQTERPDVTARLLSEGCIAIICSNSPFAITAPFSLWDSFKTIDDYVEKSTASSYLRVVRFLSFIMSFMISPLYLAFVTYNHTIIPPSLAINIASGREGVPLPSVFELLILSFGMSIIREAGLRMPGSVGYFVGTLAAVIIGQAIVTAGYVSASLIIVVAVSTIASFAISSTTLLYTSRLMNYFLIFLAGFFGMFGVISGLIFIYWHLITLESFGQPYLFPVIPYNKEGFKDTFVRLGFGFMKKRMKLQPEKARKQK